MAEPEPLKKETVDDKPQPVSGGRQEAIIGAATDGIQRTPEPSINVVATQAAEVDVPSEVVAETSKEEIRAQLRALQKEINNDEKRLKAVKNIAVDLYTQRDQKGEPIRLKHGESMRFPRELHNQDGSYSIPRDFELRRITSDRGATIIRGPSTSNWKIDANYELRASGARVESKAFRISERLADLEKKEQELMAQLGGDDAPPEVSPTVPHDLMSAPVVPSNLHQPRVLPSFLLRAFAALGCLLGKVQRLAALDIIKSSVQVPPSATKEFFEAGLLFDISYPLPREQLSIFDEMDPIRVAFHWIAMAFYENSENNEGEGGEGEGEEGEGEEGEGEEREEVEGPEGEDSSVAEEKDGSNAVDEALNMVMAIDFAELLRGYCTSPLLVWDIHSLSSPSFAWEIEVGNVVRMLVSEIEFRKAHSLIPIALHEQRVNIPLFITPGRLLYSYQLEMSKYLASKKDQLSVILEAAHLGVDWERTRASPHEEQLHVLRNSVAVKWNVAASGKVEIFSGLHFRQVSDLLSIVTSGTFRGAKMLDIDGGEHQDTAAARARYGDAWTGVYEKLVQLATEARETGQYDRKIHANLVANLRRDICNEVAMNGLVYMKDDDSYSWVGCSEEGIGLCVRRAVVLDRDLVEKLPNTVTSRATDGCFAVRQDEALREIASVSELMEECGEVGLAVMMTALATGRLKLMGRFTGYAMNGSVNGKVLQSDEYAQEKQGGQAERMLVADAMVPLKFVFAMVDEVVICEQMYGMPKGKTLVMSGDGAILSSYVSKCKAVKIVAEDFMVKDVMVG